MNLKEEIFLLLLKSYEVPERLGDDMIRHLVVKAERFYSLYIQHSQKQNEK